MRRHATVVVLLALLALPASALPTRVFVKSTGMDTGACPITTPCRSFAYAITQVAASGEVIALDTAGYGPFAPTQSVSVFAAPGITAFIAVTSGAGILIDTPVGSSDVFVLRGLALTGAGGTNGIEFVQGHSLAIENCIVSGLSQLGVLIRRSGDSTSPGVRIDHSTFRGNLEAIEIYNTGAGSSPIRLTVSNSFFVSNDIRAIDAEDNARVVVTDTVLANNGAGIVAVTATNNTVPEVDIERCSISGNGYGVSAGHDNDQGPRGIVRIAHNVITGNATGVLELADGKIMTMTSAGTTTNTIEANGTDGTFSGSYTAK